MAEKPVVEAPDSVEERARVTIRFAGDSGDGMQLAGNRFTDATAAFGNDFSTLPDFPSEIRAPAGSLAGVSSFQISFSREIIHTPGDDPDALVVMNPAALKVHLPALPRGALLIVNTDAFTTTNLKKAGYASNPLEDESLKDYRVVRAPITSTAIGAAQEVEGITGPDADRTKNFFALGLVSWVFDRNIELTLKWIDDRFGRIQDGAVAEANKKALRAGVNFANTAELGDVHVHVAPAHLQPGEYRTVTGNEATALGLLTASRLAGRDLFYGSYPITPATDVLHELAGYRHFGLRTFQAEDEIAAVGATIGASYGGAIGVTGTSGPGLALKSEAIGLAVMVELPLIVVDVQRVGPSTGMPTKTEQGDLLQALYGRNSDSPVCVIAPQSPGDCFYAAIDAVRIALQHVTPVILLSDSYLANTSEPWPVPDISQLPSIDAPLHTDATNFQPYSRDPDTLARVFAVPGNPGTEHRLGGLEKADGSGDVSYDPDNHQRMTELRQEKIDRIANFIPEIEVDGPDEGDVLVISWGSTQGAVLSAIHEARAQGKQVSSAHLRFLNPFPRNLGDIVKRFRTVLIPENNLGHLRMLIRAQFLVDAQGINKVTGQPFTIHEILDSILEHSSPRI
ncbi:MAG TPA: 2-oxoacid:acceptor oxidoreductase subunit alpha [Dehalococcoidia bacterium]|nr:2-oxoacid:acceptor oxidoreductase subunit alpha [Dehalococcoidia bacterium]